jgi:hypothetical protein
MISFIRKANKSTSGAAQKLTDSGRSLQTRDTVVQMQPSKQDLFAEKYFFQQLSTMHDDFKGTVYRKNQTCGT